MKNGPVISTLIDLIQISWNGEVFLRTAAEAAGDPELHRFFAEYADVRAASAAELEREIARLGGAPGPPDTAASRRVSGTVKVALASAGLDRLLEMAEMGEDAAERAYEKAFQTCLPTETRGMLERQYHLIRRAHDHLRGLRHGRRAA